MGVIGARRGWLVLLLALALLAAGGCLGGSKNFGSPAGEGGSPARQSPWIGKAAPDFELMDLGGKTVRLSDLGGKPVLINFWATWCPPCREEMPALEKVYRKYRDRGMVFLGIDMKEDAATVRKFVGENGFSWTFLLDSDGRVATDYQVSSIPTTYLVDREGIVRDLQIGAMSAGLMEAKLGKIQ